MSAAFHKADNLVIIVDYNQSSSMASSKTSWKWSHWRISGAPLGGGHRNRWPRCCRRARRFERAAATKGKPSCVLAHTVKGKGVSFMENNPKFHGMAPTQDELKLALQEWN